MIRVGKDDWGWWKIIRVGEGDWVAEGRRLAWRGDDKGGGR